MNSSDVLAERKLTLAQKDHETRSILVQLGRPYWVAKDQEAACPVAILGLYDNLADVHGVDPYQAMELAMQLVNTLLAAGVSKGYKLRWPNGGRLDIVETGVGPARGTKRGGTPSPRRTARKK